MIDLTFDPLTGTARLAATAVIKAGAGIPLRITFATAPGTASGLQFALTSDAAPPQVLAFTDAFSTESDTVATATLDANDTRLLAYMTGKATAAVNAEFAGTLDGVRQIAPNLQVTVQQPGITGPEASEGGPVYYTEAQTGSAITAALSSALASYSNTTAMNAAIAAAVAGLGGLTDAPGDGAAYGRKNTAWVKVTEAPFATNVSDISTWAVAGGAAAFRLDGSDVFLDNSGDATAISIYEGCNSAGTGFPDAAAPGSTVLNFAGCSGVTSAEISESGLAAIDLRGCGAITSLDASDFHGNVQSLVDQLDALGGLNGTLTAQYGEMPPGYGAPDTGSATYLSLIAKGWTITFGGV